MFFPLLFISLIPAFLFLFFIKSKAHAQYTNIIQDQNLALGQCSTNADCLIYLNIYPDLNSSSIFCNPVTTRCETLGEVLLAPAYNTGCPDVTMSIIAYPTYITTPASSQDGLIQVDFIFPSNQPIATGLVRLFTAPGSQTTFNISAGYLTDRYINYPSFSRVYFRNLEMGLYQVQFFAQIGCYLKSANILVNKTSGIPVIVSQNSTSGFFIFQGINYTVHETSRGARLALISSVWNPVTSIKDDYYGPGIGNRIPFVQIFAGSMILDSYIGSELFFNVSSTEYAFAGGASFPLRAPKSVFSPNNASQEASFLSGMVVFQFGVGYVYRDCSNHTLCPLLLVTDINGQYEGALSKPKMLNLFTIGPGMTQIQNYTATPMFVINNFIYTNTQYMYVGADLNLTKLVDMTSQPKVSIIDYFRNPLQPTSFNGWCFDPLVTVQPLVVFMDYTAFPFAVQSPYLILYHAVQTGYETVNSTSTSNRFTLIPTVPPQKFLILNGVYALFVYEPGFYCAALQANLFDGFGERVFFQTCFQINTIKAYLTQEDSFFVQSLNPFNPITESFAYNNYTAYGGFEATVDYTFIANLPQTLVLMAGETLEISLNRYSNDPFQTLLLIEQGGANAEGFAINDIFTLTMGTVDALDFYSVISFNNSLFIYSLEVNIYSAFNYVDIYIEGASVTINELAAASIVVYNTSALPLIYTFINTGIPIPILPIYNETLVIVSGGGLGNLTYDYNCNAEIDFQMQEATTSSTRIITIPGVCPEDRAAMYAYTKGSFPFHKLNVASPDYNPAQDSLAYFDIWYNADNASVGYGDILGSGNNFVLFPAPENILIGLRSCDTRGLCAEATAIATSLVSPNATVIIFFPQLPLCLANATNTSNGQLNSTYSNTQLVVMSYALNNEVSGRIEFWAVGDPDVPLAYTPTLLSFNIPSDCSLLISSGGPLTPFQAQTYCVTNPPLILPANCTGCLHLPTQYEKANGRTLTTAVDEEIWQVVIWTPTGSVDPTTNRSVYCRTISVIISNIPNPLSLTFSQLQKVPNAAPGCENTNTCFYATIKPVLDPDYSNIYTLAAVTFLSAPNLVPYIANNLPFQYYVEVGIVYNITLLIPNIFCPVNFFEQTSSLGPQIVYIHTTRTSCATNDPSGTATVYMRYNNPSPDVSVTGTLVPLCFYWPGRRGPTFAVADEIPFAFVAPTNPIQPTLLPYAAAFGFDNQFTNLVGGVQQLMIYERCTQGANAGGCGCKSPLAMNFQLLETQLNFAYEELTINNFENPEGGLVIVKTAYQQAYCYGDTYFLNISGYDAGDNSPYELLLKEPGTGAILQQYGACIITNANQTLPPPQPFGPFQVFLGAFPFYIATKDKGIGPSGNYTVILRSCKTTCVATNPTYINYVTPILTYLSTDDGTCAYKPNTLTTQVIGGTPCNVGSNCSTVVTFPGVNITYSLIYSYFWKTPLHPSSFVETYLAPQQYPGLYQLKVCDLYMCCAYQNISIGGASAITITSITSNQVCQISNNATVRFNVTGGKPPYFLLQDLTSINASTVISFDFVATYNQTMIFYVMDSTYCINPNPVSLTLSDPGPVILNVTHKDSCRSTPTGTVHVTSPTPIICTWQSSGFNIPVIQSCTLVNIPYGSYLVVTATTNIGCVGTQAITVGLKTPIVITQTERSTIGVFNGPCIDNITFAITGGSEGPPYLITLVNDETGANFTIQGVFNGTENVLVQGVCASFLYTIVATELDGSCSVLYTSSDPQYNTGASPGGIAGLSPANKDFLPCTTSVLGGGHPPFTSKVGIIIIAFLVLSMGGIVAIVYYNTYGRIKARLIDEEKSQLTKKLIKKKIINK